MSGKFILAAGFGFDDGNWEITSVAEPLVSPLLFQPPTLLFAGGDSAISEGMLLLNLIVRPARPVEIGQDVEATGIGFGLRHELDPMSSTSSDNIAQQDLILPLPRDAGKQMMSIKSYQSKS
jgi:hypothetical protein